MGRNKKVDVRDAVVGVQTALRKRKLSSSCCVCLVTHPEGIPAKRNGGVLISVTCPGPIFFVDRAPRVAPPGRRASERKSCSAWAGGMSSIRWAQVAPWTVASYRELHEMPRPLEAA